MKKYVKIAITLMLGSIFLILGTYNIYHNYFKPADTPTTFTPNVAHYPKGSQANPYTLNEEIPLNMTSYLNGDLDHPIYGAGLITFNRLILGQEALALLEFQSTDAIPTGYQLAILDTTVALTASNSEKKTPLQLIYQVYLADGSLMNTKHYGFFTNNDIFLKSLAVNESTTGYSVILLPSDLTGVTISVAYITDMDKKWVLLEP